MPHRAAGRFRPIDPRRSGRAGPAGGRRASRAVQGRPAPIPERQRWCTPLALRLAPPGDRTGKAPPAPRPFGPGAGDAGRAGRGLFPMVAFGTRHRSGIRAVDING